VCGYLRHNVCLGISSYFGVPGVRINNALARNGSFHAHREAEDALQAIGHIAGAVVPIAPRAWRQ
jgi:hypothetical protein